MKKVILTNATVIPFYKRNPNDPDEIIRVIKPAEGSDFKSNIVSFNVETKVQDSGESKARLFEKCTIYAKNEDQINNIRGSVKNGAIVEIEGYEKRTKSQKDDKWYTGVTSDLRKRFKQHNNQEVVATKGRGPFKIIYYEACLNKQDAYAREKYLKTGMGKRYLKNRLKRFLSLERK